MEKLFRKKSQMLRSLMNERLTAAAEEIFALFERTIAEYEEELCGSKEEKERRQQLLDSVERRDTRSRGVSTVSPTEESEPDRCLFEELRSEIKQEPEEEEVSGEREVGYPLLVVQIDEERSVLRPSPDTDYSEDWNHKGDPPGHSSTLLQTEAIGEDILKASPKVKTFVCSECGRGFSWRSTWRRHLSTHSETSPYSCSVCCRRFPQKSHLVTHMVTHTGEKPFSCSQCNAKFSQKQNLVRHMTVHSGERSYSCSVCGKQFSHKHSVQLHMLTHTGEKPFSCSLCDSRFTKKPHLNRHMKCCHSGEKPYSCPVCQKSFIQKCDVQRHLKIHTKNTSPQNQT